MEREFSGVEKRLFLILFLAMIVVISGFAYLFMGDNKPPEKNFVGVININGPILTVEGTEMVVDSINKAFINSSIKSVVLKIDSPGGYAHLIEEIYLDILELKNKKPVVASIITALSGGYYIAVAADYIYASPSSMVGNIGVIGVAPESHTPSERDVETGPHKVTGFSRLLFPFNISNVLESFAGAVEERRGDRLKISPEVLRRGSIYMGKEAISVGLVDDLGALQRAAEHAALAAGIDSYEIVDIVSKRETEGELTSLSGGIQWRELTISTLNELYPPPAIYYLYLPSQAYKMENTSTVLTVGDSNGAVETKKGRVVVDLSHGNQISSDIFHLLSAELAMRGVYTRYEDTWEEVEVSLASAAALIIAAPTEVYSYDEFQTIKDFVANDRILLMFYDPALEYNDATSSILPINSLANRFGLTFARGYLYNMEEKYGLYRNIYVSSFKESNLTRDLASLVFLTATHIHSTDSDAAWTDDSTFSSISEKQGKYATVSILDKGNGTMAAFGDLTFLTEPFAYLEDNYQLIMNLVSVVTEIRVPVVEEPEEPDHNITEPNLPVGTVKTFIETIDGEVDEMIWTRTAENKTRVQRPNRITVYNLDEEGRLLSWVSDGIEQVFDEPLPDLPYPLIEDVAWAYRVGYNLTIDNQSYRGILESHGQIGSFEYVEAVNGEKYWCAKIFISETDELDRVDDLFIAESSQFLWVSSEAGLVKAEIDTSYYVDETLVLEEKRSLILQSIDLGEG